MDNQRQVQIQEERLVIPVQTKTQVQTQTKTQVQTQTKTPKKQEFPILRKNGLSEQVKVKEGAKEPKTVVKTVALKIENAQEEDNFRLSGKSLTSTFNEVMQSGYRSLKSFQAQKAAEWKEVPDKYLGPEKEVEIESETINKYKQTYRSGYQEKNTSNMVSDLQITMGRSEPALITNGKCQGSIAYDNGWSGNIKEAIKMKYR